MVPSTLNPQPSTKSRTLPKVVMVACRSNHLPKLFITKFKSQFKRVFTEVVV